MEMAHGASGESRVERAAPWVSSFLMHAGIGLLVAFVVFVAVGRKPSEEALAPDHATGDRGSTRSDF